MEKYELKFGVYTNPKRDPQMVATKMLLEMLEHEGVQPSLDPQTAQALGIAEYENARSCNVLFVLGGDGTILRAVREYVPFGIQFVGINLGHMGFMSEIDLGQVPEFVHMARTGQCRIDARMMLEASMPGHESVHALNDFVLTRSQRSKMASIELSVNGLAAERFTGDGLIVATPTGSTAYSLSASGPIVAPNVKCILLTPLCPHSLVARSIVTAPEDVIEVRSTYHALSVSADGRRSVAISKGTAVRIVTADRAALFLRLPKDNFYATLQTKLAQWGGASRP